jgi:two-component system, NtrC family, sensor kinase
MNRTEILQNILLVMAAIASITALVFFYQKTQAVDLREQNEVFELISELRVIDNRWDFEVQRARNESSGLPALINAEAGDKALRSITRIAQRTMSRVLRAGLTDLRKDIQLKAELVEKFKIENSKSKDALQTILKNVAELGTLAAARKSKQIELVQALNQLAAIAPQYYMQVQDALSASMQAATNQLRAAPIDWHDKTARVDAAVQDMLAHRPVEQELFSRLEVLTSGPRLVSMALSYNSELEDIFEEKERYRIYLIYYSGALLILLAYLGFKIKAANQRLEHRVIERTHELSEAMKHLKESEAQLIQSEKMSSLGQMVAGVAHEINTPLAYVKNSLGAVAEQLPGISGTLEHCEKLIALLKAGDNPDELSREFAHSSTQIAQLRQQHVIEELSGLVKDGLYGTGQVAEIVGNLKDFSRLDRSKVTSFNLNEGLESTLLLAKHLLKTVTVDKRFGEIPAITCSPSQVNQVFLNLVTNAAQALPDGRGKIILTTRVDGEGVAVDVVDNGSGIPPEVIKKIFDPFFTTKEIGKGTGLGLSISYKIVEQHGGRISVDSKVGAGTKFTVSAKGFS